MTRSASTRALVFVMGAAVIAWVLFIIARYIALVSSAGPLLDDSQPERVRISDYVTLAAIVVLGIGALLAKRRLAAIRASDEPRGRLVDAVSRFSSLMLIVAAALTAWAVIFTFMNGFFAGPEERDPVVRLFNLYVPIVLYAALLVALILAGFVFLAPAVRPETAEPESGPPAAAHAGGQRTTGLAYATPIIAAAIALILGLVVYDLTHTALQVWIWVVIFVIVGAGILAGTALAARSAGASDVAAPVVAGAKTLNFVLAILFAVVVASMSLGYGASAVAQLNVSPGLSLSAYGNSEKYGDDGSQDVTMNDVTVSLWGNDLQRGSTVTVTLEPGDSELLSTRVSAERWVSDEKKWPDDLTAGAYELTAAATATDGAAIEITLAATVLDSGEVRFPHGSSAYFNTDTSRLLPASTGWFFGDLLPAGVLLVLGIAMIWTTLIARNRTVRVTS